MNLQHLITSVGRGTFVAVEVRQRFVVSLRVICKFA